MSVKTYDKRAQGEQHICTHFKIKEFACQDGANTVLIDDVLVQKLEKLHSLLDCKTIIIVSEYINTNSTHVDVADRKCWGDENVSKSSNINPCDFYKYFKISR
jgi:hypothetical protein